MDSMHEPREQYGTHSRAARPGGCRAGVPCGRTRVQWTACMSLGSNMVRAGLFAKVQLCPGWAISGVQSGTKAPLSGPNSQSNLGEVFGQEVRVDGKRRFGPFGGGDDHPLDRAGGVPGHVQTAQVRRLVLSGPDGSLVVEVATEGERELR